MKTMKAIVEKTAALPFDARQLLYGVSVFLTFGVVGRIAMVL